MECAQRALEIRQTVFDGNHPLLATSLQNMGAAYYNLAEYNIALQYYARALAML